MKRGAVRDHLLEVLEDTLDLRSVGAVVFHAVDEGRNGDAAGIRGAWGEVFERAAVMFLSTAGTGLGASMATYLALAFVDAMMWCGEYKIGLTIVKLKPVARANRRSMKSALFQFGMRTWKDFGFRQLVEVLVHRISYMIGL